MHRRFTHRRYDSFKTQIKISKIISKIFKTLHFILFMSYTLIICEKPQAAMKIAYCLSEVQPVKKNILGVPFYEISKNNEKIIVASAVGHLFELTEKIKTKTWPVFDIDWSMKKNYALKYLNVLKQLAENASDFIIACDYDIEGELIGFNILRFIFNTEKAKRMKFSTLTKYELQNSFENALPNIDYSQAYAGETRHYLDWFYGINLSRALMQAIHEAGSYNIMSIGRVQGPALSLVVSREQEITNFNPKKYWQVSLLVQDEKKDSVEVFYKENFFDKAEAEQLEKLNGKNGSAETKKENQNIPPFPPFDLTALQIEAYKHFGLSPSQTLAIAQNLYLRGLISYPRTSSQKLPFSVGYKRIIDKLKEHFPKLAESITREKPIEGRKIDPAHPSIFPTGEISNKLSAQEKKIFELIVKRFVACFSSDALVENKKIKIKVGDYEFHKEGRKILEKGWLEVYPAKIEEKIIPDINGTVTVLETRIIEKETLPPRRYSPASLVSELEKRGLGTKATRANIIDTLYKRNYISEREIKATKLGMVVALTLQRYCPLIMDEKLTRKFEREIDSIQKKRKKEDMLKQEQKILDNAKKILMEIAEQFKAREKEIGAEILKAVKTVKKQETEANTFFSCPKCGAGNLIMLRSKNGKRFLACNKYPECKTTFPLPQYGLIKSADKTCECGWPMLTLIRKGMPPWNFCINPYCISKKRKENEKIAKEKNRKSKSKKTKSKKKKEKI